MAFPEEHRMKSPLYRKFEQSKNAIEDGVWVEFVEAEGDQPAVRVKIRSSRCKAAKRVRNEITQRAISKGARLNRNEDAEVVEVLSKAIVIDWQGVTDRDGNTLPCNPETVQALLSDPELEPFREQILVASATDETFRKEAIEATVGNSPSTTGTV
jgi:hypothetical protein